MASGEGTTADAYARAIYDQAIDAEVGLVITTKETAGICRGEESRKRSWGFDARLAIVNNELFSAGPRERGQTEAASTEVCRLLDRTGIDLVLQLGYMTIANDPYVAEWGFDPSRHDSHLRARALNWHPGLLPLTADTFGVKASRIMLESWRRGEITEAGHTAHVLAQEVDGGATIVQTPVPIEPTDTPESLRNRLHLLERAVTPYIPGLYLKIQQDFLIEAQ